TELSTTSWIRWCKPRTPVEPMYMPGRLRTASKPSSTVMEDALYSLFFAATGLTSPRLAQRTHVTFGPTSGPKLILVPASIRLVSTSLLGQSRLQAPRTPLAASQSRESGHRRVRPRGLPVPTLFVRFQAACRNARRLRLRPTPRKVNRRCREDPVRECASAPCASSEPSAPEYASW